ncbi:MAG TPA: nucleotide sugar dehydrogenase, partial [Candidatus Ignatzschineria merdigallinarum]|nr:nucleotide sugar dehydrogenase [Candidatus Ignatzschineria merdigallinarum]
MKVAVIGTTLQAGVMTALLSEYGNEVSVYAGVPGSTCDTNIYEDTIRDAHLLSTLKKHAIAQRFDLIQDLQTLPMADIECYLFCYDPAHFAEAAAFIQSLPKYYGSAKRLMINSGTFGLYGTEKLQALAPDDAWVYLPDTVQEGKSIESFLKRQKVIVGVEDAEAKRLLKELFRPFFPLDSQYLWMPILDAELVKMSISGMLATRISYMNDLANVAEKMGIDIVNIKEGLASDSRIGSSYLSPGAGFGGENFSLDILMLSNVVSESGIGGRLLEQVWAINEEQKEILFRKLWRFYQTNLKGKRIAIWGATFKEGTSSTYNAPIHQMIAALKAQGAAISLYDPEGSEAILAQYGEDVVEIAADKYQALTNADALCVLTAWQEFYSPDYYQMLALMKTPLLLDGRNMYDPEFMKAQGFIYEGV